MRTILFILAALCFGVRVLLSLFGGSSGKLDLQALGACLFVCAFLV